MRAVRVGQHNAVVEHKERKDMELHRDAVKHTKADAEHKAEVQKEAVWACMVARSKEASAGRLPAPVAHARKEKTLPPVVGRAVMGLKWPLQEEEEEKV